MHCRASLLLFLCVCVVCDAREGRVCSSCMCLCPFVRPRFGPCGERGGGCWRASKQGVKRRWRRRGSVWPPPHCEISRVVKRARCREGRRARGKGGNNIERMGFDYICCWSCCCRPGLGWAPPATHRVSRWRAPCPSFVFAAGDAQGKGNQAANQTNQTGVNVDADVDVHRALYFFLFLPCLFDYLVYFTFAFTMRRLRT